MEVVIRGTNKTEFLKITHGGCADFIGDLIGTVDAWGDFAKELDGDGEWTGRWIADADTINWWQDYVRKSEILEEKISALREELAKAMVDDDEIDEVIAEIINVMQQGDMEREHPLAMYEINRIRVEYELPNNSPENNC